MCLRCQRGTKNKIRWAEEVSKDTNGAGWGAAGGGHHACPRKSFTPPFHAMENPLLTSWERSLQSFSCVTKPVLRKRHTADVRQLKIFHYSAKC